MNKNIFDKTMVEMTWTEVEEAAKENAIVLLPVGMIEEHSRHLPLGTDIYIAAVQAQQIAEELKRQNVPCVIAPACYWGISSVVTKYFPGTFTMRKETVIHVITDILNNLEEAGFQRVVAINAHGDTAHREAIVEAFVSFNEEHKLKARWLTYEDDLKMQGYQGTEEFLLVIPPYPLEKLMKYEDTPVDSFDIHAGAFETAIMRDLFPELTNMEVANQLPATMLKDQEITRWCEGKKEDCILTPDGHAGDPAFAQYLSSDLESADVAIAHGIMVFYEREQNRE